MGAKQILGKMVPDKALLHSQNHNG